MPTPHHHMHKPAIWIPRNRIRLALAHNIQLHNPQHRRHELEVELFACLDPLDEEPEDEHAEGEEHRACADRDEVGGAHRVVQERIDVAFERREVKGGDDDVLRRAAVRYVEEDERGGGRDELQDDHNHDERPYQEIVPLRNVGAERDEVHHPAEDRDGGQQGV
ncbi:hypothetical protein B0H17DRAFT_1143594 [Mycena rosella]|uniref:Uncharacterized protein n=1 Tax=Mycena rosella TaxID=1033263 RepID=A0AAD7CV88_MYCRO|nr:hypothetical protein B0H17DRAFT_1143594 [Mycena rosella]